MKTKKLIIPIMFCISLLLSLQGIFPGFENIEYPDLTFQHSRVTKTYAKLLNVLKVIV